MTQDMNETYGHRAHLASIWQGVGKVLARCWQGHELAKCLRSACHHYGKSMGRVWLRRTPSPLPLYGECQGYKVHNCLGIRRLETVGGIQGEFTQNSRGIQAEFKENSGRIPVDGSKMVRRWLEDGSKMKGSASQYDGFVLPVRRQRTASTSGANCQYVGLVLRSFRYAACLILMMIVGVGEMWGQETPDYSGTYYIASGGKAAANGSGYTYNPSDPSSNFYLCPTEGWCYYQATNDFWPSNTDEANKTMPFLTTYKCRDGVYDASKAVWIIKKVKKVDNTEYYYIKQKETGRYLVSNGQIRTTGNKGQDRIRVHLENLGTVAESDLDDKALFSIDYDNVCWRISPKDLTNGDYYTEHSDHLKHTYLVVNFGNYNYLDGRSGKDGGPTGYTNTAGTVGIYTQNDANSPFYLEEYIFQPTIAYNNETNEVTISTTTSGATIYYTMGDNPGNPTSTSNNGSGESGSSTVTISDVTNPTTIKAIAIKGVLFSDVAETEITKVATPTINLNYENGTYTVTLACETTDAAIFYRIGESGDFTPYSIPFTVANNSIIFAYATKDECIKSERSSLTARATCATPSITISYNDGTATVTITNNENDATIHYTTDGSVPDVNSQSTPLTFNVTSGMTVRAIAVKTDYNNSDIAEETVNQVAMPVIEIVNNEITISCATTDYEHIYYAVDNGGVIEYIEYTRPLGLADNVSGKTIRAYATKTGMVKSATAVADASTTKLQMPTPVITYNPATNKVVITSTPGATITYTTGKTETEAGDPTEEYTYGNTGFVLPNYHHVIKAKAEMSDEDPSDVAILTITVQTTTDTNNPIPYLIQSVECTDFYMLPGDSKGVNTSSLGRPSMEWCFYYAGKSEGSGDAGVAYDYYYIKNKETDQYVYFIFKDNKTTLRLDSKETFEAADATGRNNYKYRLVYVDDATNPGYYIHPYTSGTAVNGLIKTNGNNAADAIGLASGTDKNTARWNFVPSSDITSLAPQLNSWDKDGRKYYQIKNVKSNNNLLPRTATSSYATASTATDNNLWYFDEVSHDKWVTYYYIVNATTGEYLYFNGNVNADANSNAFDATEEFETDDDRYQFALAKTTTSGQYYILPKSLITRGINSYRLVYWDGIFPLSTAANRAASEGKWTLTESTVKALCPPRIYLDADGNVTMASRTRRATISYTIDGGEATTFTDTDPTIRTIRTMATEGEKVVINTTTTFGGVTTTKEVTVVYKPDIEFDPEQTIVYNGEIRVPALSSVITGGIDYKDYCMLLSDAINAGNATAVITQKENYPFHAGSYYVIYGTEAFTIDQSPLTITADAMTIEYGEQVPTEFTFSTSGLAYTDIVNVHLVCTTADNSSLGSYPITFTESVQDVTITQQGTNVKNNYKDITLIPSTLTVTPKRIGDGVVPAEHISIDLTGTDFTATNPTVDVKHYNHTLTAGEDGDYTVAKGAENERKEVVLTISGKGNYTGAAQVACVKPTFVGNGETTTPTEYIAAFNGSVDWVPTATEWGVDNDSKNIWMITSVIPSVNIVTAVPITYLPKDMPVILTSEEQESNGIYVVPKSSETESISDVDRNRNLLKMTPAGGLPVQNGQVYVFYNKKDANTTGTGEFVLALAGRVPAGRFYIENPNYTPTGVQGAPARLRIIFGESTVSGITELQNDESTESQNGPSTGSGTTWYSIDGRRLSGKPRAKGLYIVDGKKVMVK